MSCSRFEANQFRLFMHSAAYVLLHTLRSEILRGTEYAKATMKTIRLRLIKVATYVKEMKTLIRVELPKQYLDLRIFAKGLGIFEVLCCQCPFETPAKSIINMIKIVSPNVDRGGISYVLQKVLLISQFREFVFYKTIKKHIETLQMTNRGQFFCTGTTTDIVFYPIFEFILLPKKTLFFQQNFRSIFLNIRILVNIS